MGSLDKGLWPPNTPITPRVDELNVTSQPISKSVQTYLLRTNSDHGPVSKDLLFFKLASDVSGVELLRLNYMKAHRTAYGERMTEAQEQQLDSRAFPAENME